MSGPVALSEVGSIDTMAINASAPIDGFIANYKLTFGLINEELVPAAYILGKINGVDILCPGPAESNQKVPLRPGALPPNCRRLERREK